MPEGNSGTSQPCPSCGINVMVGYIKCPKCHATMPGQEKRARRSSFGGGTTSQPLERIDQEGGGSWIWAVLGIVLVAGVVVWATQLRGGSKKKPVEASVPVETGNTVGTDVPVAPESNDPVPVPSTDRPDPAFAADALEADLAIERLFATVDIVNGVLEVRSAFCNEARLGEIVARYAADLRTGGVATIRCSETHGEQIFSRPL